MNSFVYEINLWDLEYDDYPVMKLIKNADIDKYFFLLISINIWDMILHLIDVALFQCLVDLAEILQDLVLI